MSNTTIPNLPSAISLTGSEQIEVVQSGTSVRSTTGAIAQLVTTSGTVTSIATTSPIVGGTITTTGTISLAANGITNSFLGPMNPYTVKANNTAGTVAPQDITFSTFRTAIGAAPLNSPNFTGVPTAPTTSSSDDSASIATTAYVKLQGYAASSITITGTGAVSGGGNLTANRTLTLASIANGYVIANTTGSSASPTGVTLSSVIDTAMGSGVGSMLYRSSGGWTSLSAGTSGQLLQTQGVGSAPTWTTVSGTGTVTSITAGTGLSGGTITTSGTIAIANTAVTATSYGSSTAIPTFTVNAQGQLTAASTTAVIAPAGTLTGTTLASNVVSSSLTSVGTIATGVWNGTTIAIANGGTGQTSASAAFNALSPITSVGDLIIGNGTNSATRLGIGTNGYVLTSNGTTATWSAVASSVTTFSAGTTGFTPSSATSGAVTLAGTLNIANGGTGITSFGTGVQTALGQNVTGSGSIVLSTNAVMTTPNLGTPSAITLTNGTGLPLSTGVTGTLPATNGGTGQSSYAVGDLLYASTTTALSRLADVATGSVLVSGGVGVAPAWSAATSVAVTSINFGTTGLTPSTATQGAITVAGTLVAANGGTGQSSYTTGDLLYASSSTAIGKLADVATGSVLVSGGVGVAPSWSTSPAISALQVNANSSTDAVRITQLGTGNVLLVEDSPNPDGTPFLIDQNGILVHGVLSAVSVRTINHANQYIGSTFNNASGLYLRYSNDVNPSGVEFSKTRSSTYNGNTIVASGDNIGTQIFSADDGTQYLQAGSITASIDGTPGVGSMPGRIVLSTTPSGSSTPSERMRIDSSGNVGIGTSSPVQKLDVAGTIRASVGLLVYNGGGSATANLSYGTNSQWQLESGFGATNNLRFYDVLNSAERMRIDGSGNVNIATTGVAAKLYVNGNSASNIYALTDGATITPDFSTGNNFSVTLGGNRTLANPTNMTVGQSGVIYVSQDATGSRTLAYGTYWKFPGGTAPTLTTTASATDALFYVVRTSTSITVNSALNIG